MRRATARGRMLPQSLSTDPRIGHLSLKAVAVFPFMWANCDDQGRLSGNPEEIKYAVCPNIDQITKADIPKLLKELEAQGFIKAYSTSKTRAIQMLDWWEVQKLQWAYPSNYPPPAGWNDRLRYHASPTQIVTENWPPKSNVLPSALASSSSPEKLPEGSKDTSEKEIEEEYRRRRGRGNLPSALGSKPSPSPATSKDILDKLKYCYESGWNKKAGGKVSAQLRDLAEGLSAAGCPLDHIEEAFKEAAVMNIYSISYVRKILLAWLGTERGPPT